MINSVFTDQFSGLEVERLVQWVMCPYNNFWT